MIKVENWCGHDIRFVEQNGEWWAILKDICDALNLRTDGVAQRLDPDMLTRVPVEMDFEYDHNHSSNGVRKPRSSSGTVRKVHWMLAVNEIGIYEALFASRRLEARKFRRWSASVMQKLRTRVGLEGYEVMRMTEPEIQEDIDHILDTLFYDEETDKIMQSITVAGGDVEQVPFE
jgi:prophage antirepressor-like protein|nr:MAG TPA: antirepressor [Herelleviridae sp.]